MTKRVTALEAVAGRWNELGVRYSVISGLDGYPEEVGRDLDVLVNEADVELALASAKSVLQVLGWRVGRAAQRVEPQLYAVLGEEMLELHVIRRIAWGLTELMAEPRPTDSRGPFPVDPWSTVAKRLILPLLKGSPQKILDRSADLTRLLSEEPQAMRRLGELVGATLAQDLQASLATASRHEGTGDRAAYRASGLAECRVALRRALFRKGLARPGRALRLLVLRARTRFERYLWPRGVVVALVGPDGVGKSSLMRALEQQPKQNFMGFEFRHWRPRLLPNLGAAIGRSDGPAQPGAAVPPRRRAGRFPALRKAYYALDYALGYWFKDRPAVAGMSVVFYDRHSLDMSVDPLRFGLPAGTGELPKLPLVPRPDLTILLEDDPERIHSRKAELPVEEIERQLAHWQKLVDDGLVHAVIRVDGPPEELARTVLRLTARAFVDRLAARTGETERPDPPSARVLVASPGADHDN